MYRRQYRQYSRISAKNQILQATWATPTIVIGMEYYQTMKIVHLYSQVP